MYSKLFRPYYCNKVSGAFQNNQVKQVFSPCLGVFYEAAFAGRLLIPLSSRSGNESNDAFPCKEDLGNESFDSFLNGIGWKWDGGCISRAV